MAQGHGRECRQCGRGASSVMPTREGRTWNSQPCGGFKVPGQLSPSPSGALFSCSRVAFGARHGCCGITVPGSGLGSGSTWNLLFGRLLWPFMALCAKGGLPVLPGLGVSLVVCCGSGQCHVGCCICSAVLGNSCVPTAQEIVVSSIPSCLFYPCHGGTWHEPKPSGCSAGGEWCLQPLQHSCGMPPAESSAAGMGDGGKQRATVERGTRCSPVPLLLAPKFQVAVAALAPAPARALAPVPAQLPPALPSWGNCKARAKA